MPLTKADLRDTTLLIEVGNTAAARRILASSDDPRAAQLLANFDKRFPPEAPAAAPPRDDLKEVKRLLAQEKFDEAESLLEISQHPDADRLLRKIGQLKAQHWAGSSSRTGAKAKRSSLKAIFKRISGIFLS